MYFWDRVQLLVEKEGLSRKEVAMNCKFDVSLFSKGAGTDVTPSAQVACDIAKLLHTTVEYLVYGENPTILPVEKKALELYYKYGKTLKDIDSLPEQQQRLCKGVVSEIYKSYTADLKKHKKLKDIKSSNT